MPEIDPDAARRAKHCVTHYHACDCREAEFAALAEQAKALEVELATLREEREDAEKRLQWVLPLVTGTDGNEADGRTAAMMMALGRGLDGIEAIDFAMNVKP